MALIFKSFSAAGDLSPSVWNRLASEASPMMEWEYYHSLEKSGSVATDCGYSPCHLLAFKDGRPIALAPLYERNRAWVEFGDGGLLEFLTEFTGMPYCTGLLGAIPFTPVPGYQFLHDPTINRRDAYRILLSQIDFICKSKGFFTSRIYFVAVDDIEMHGMLRDNGYITLQNQYSYWFNRDYRTFDDYLQAFKSSRRTKIKREIRTVRELGINVEVISGEEVPDASFLNMHDLYLHTWKKHMGEGIRPFLNRSFFQSLTEVFRHRTMFSVARKTDEILGLAIFYHKERSIYGRYWGAYRDVPFLHFSTCYYSPIEWAIRHGVRMMDPGFGGEHKLIRGFETVPVYHYVKFHGEEESRIAMTVLRRLWGNVARKSGRS